LDKAVMRPAALTVQARILARRRSVYVPAIGAEQLNSVHTGHIGSSAGQDVCRMAEDTGARAEMALLVLVDLAMSAGAWTTMHPMKPINDGS
jgi:hypothetical protein